MTKRAGWTVFCVVMLAGMLWAQETPQPLGPMPANASPAFETVTIKPSEPNHRGGGFTRRGRHVMSINTTVNELIGFAYGIRSAQILGSPGWAGTDRFDIDGVPDAEGLPNQAQWAIMIQKLLADRFELTFHREEKELPAYAVVVGKNGSKLTKTSAKPGDPTQFMFKGPGNLTAANITMREFAEEMGHAGDRPMVDQTGLADKYDFTLKWTPDHPETLGKDGNPVPPPPEDPNAPPVLFTAIQEQLGLKLEPTRTKASVIVVDKVQKPSEN